MAALETSYTATPAGSPNAGGGAQTGREEQSGQYWPLEKLRKAYTDYLFSKRQEIDEQIKSRRYYHGTQYTDEQIKALNKRKQPVMTFNRISRKINGVVGLVEKLRQDPKAYARTPMHQDGADLATAAIRYVLDEQAWKDKSPQVAQDGAVDGLGGVEIILRQGDQGDPEVEFEVVDTQSFFYDPRSWRADFSDARYMGQGKWIDLDIAQEMFPDANFDESGSDLELISNTDRDLRWFVTEGIKRRIRLVDIWYRQDKRWCYAIFSGSMVLKEGTSYLKDEKGEDICKYIMFSAEVDADGDRYGFVRNMQSAQDGINAKQSKMQHILGSKRLIISQGAVDDVEKTRTEWARPDGVVVTNRPVNEGVKADDQSFDFAGWTKMLELNLQEIENFGPNPALIGQGLENQSGRAIALLQQAGLSELGPYILGYKGWKVRLYRALWNAVQQHWQAERWIRVTDDQNLAQYLQVNKLGIDPMTGQPTIVNALGSLDVDIILDEGPDYVNSMADVYDTLSNILPSVAPLLNPAQAQNIIGVLMETSPLPGDVKKRFVESTQQAAQQPPPPDPKVEAMKAQAMLEQQSMQQKAQLEAQKANNDLQLKQMSTAADIEQSRQKTAAEIEAMYAKANADVQIQRDKAAHDLEIKHAQAMLDHEHKSADHEMRIREMQVKAESTPENVYQKRKSAEDKDSADKFAAIADKFHAGMSEMAKAMSAPRKLKVERDGAGRVVGAST